LEWSVDTILDANYPFLNTCIIETDCPASKPTGQTDDLPTGKNIKAWTFA